MQRTELEKQIEALQEKIDASQKQLIALKQEWGKGPVKDYELQGPNGPVKLSQAFGDHSLMVLIHNMGHQ
jgi:hypothetical protein